MDFVGRSYRGSDAVAALAGLLGRRVALRYRVSGTTLTDAVGELAPAGPEAVAVHTRSGPVTIGTVSVVAVREIPPARPKRPSWAVVSRLEGICADAWPALVDRPLGQWRLRAAGGFTGRANGCLAIGDPGVPLPDALALAREFAVAHRLVPRVQVVQDSPWHTAVTRQGWVPDDRHPAGWRVEVLVGELAGITAVPPPKMPAPDMIKITLEGRERWRVAAVEPPDGPFDPRFDTAQEYVLTAPALPHVAFAVARRGAETIGSVRAVVLDEHLYVARLSVAEEHRRHGLGTALMAAAAGWAAERGARWCVLQVARENAAALALYQRLDCTPHHRFHYLRPPG
jgi:ribosomal protein S18 acetylase RimI-like enzyme